MSGLTVLDTVELMPVIELEPAKFSTREHPSPSGTFRDVPEEWNRYLAEWRDAASYRQPDWKMVWIGHPWISVRFEAGWLVFSEPHESESPVGRWAVNPEEFGRAVAVAEDELEDFARRLVPVLEAMGVAEAGGHARRLAGLGS